MNDTVQAQMENRESYVTSRFNALQHGVLSRYVVLPWEDEKEYQALLGALVAEHKPQGPTEEHLVEELAGILWRKRRLRLAEGAACRRGLVNVASDRRTVDAALVHLDIAVNDTSRELADVDQAEATTTCAVDLLQTGKARAYEKALAMLPDDTQERWTELRKPILGLQAGCHGCTPACCRFRVRQRGIACRHDSLAQVKSVAEVRARWLGHRLHVEYPPGINRARATASAGYHGAETR
jgi:hypothetical protein